MDLQEWEAIAVREMHKHGLQGWTFGWANTKRRLGVCKYHVKRIEIAEFFARNNGPEAVLDTLLHEIAHALAGPKAGHGPEWKAVAVRLGAQPHSCKKSHETVVKPGDWQATCPACQRTFHRYRRPRTLTGYRCRCAARAELTFAYTGELRPPAPPIRQQCANWEAKCAGCETIHLRIRKPKPGTWRCRCHHRCELTWVFRSR